MITSGMSVLAVLFMAVGETLTMQAYGAATASMELRFSCLQCKPLVGFRSSRHPLHRLNPTISRIYL